MNFPAITRRIRRCESEVPAQLVLEYAIAEAVKAEREACAKVCEAMKTRPPSELDDSERGYNASLRRAAEAIRLRSNAMYTAKPANYSGDTDK